MQESRARYSEAGFTLFEMLVALALLAFAMAIALPTLKTSNSGASLKAVALSLAADQKAARVSAVMRGMPISVRFLAQPRVYLRDGEREPTRLPQSIAMTLFPRDGILPYRGRRTCNNLLSRRQFHWRAGHPVGGRDHLSGDS